MGGHSRIAVDRVARQVGVEAERAETGRLWEADHGEGAGMVLAVERSHGGLRRAGLASEVEGNLRVVEPEADVEGVGRIEPDDGVEPEDLVDEDGLDGGHIAIVVLHLQVRLVPGEAEALVPGDEGGIDGSAGEEL